LRSTEVKAIPKAVPSLAGPHFGLVKPSHRVSRKRPPESPRGSAVRRVVSNFAFSGALPDAAIFRRRSISDSLCFLRGRLS